jgi:hypothetical protein
LWQKTRERRARRRAVRPKPENPADQQPDAAVPVAVPKPEFRPLPVVAEPFRFDELVPGDGEPDMPRVAPPVAAVPHGRPLAPIRPELLEFEMLPSVLLGALLIVPGAGGLLDPVELAAVLGFDVVGLVALEFSVPWLMALGFDALGLGLPGVVAVLPAAVPGVAPAPPALCASARPPLPRRATAAIKASRCLVCVMCCSL